MPPVHRKKDDGDAQAQPQVVRKHDKGAARGDAAKCKGATCSGAMIALVTACVCLAWLNVVLLYREFSSGGALSRADLAPAMAARVTQRDREVAARPRTQVLSWEPRIFLIPDVLTRQECDEIIMRAEPRLEKIGTFSKGRKKSPRSSESMWFSQPRDDQDDVVAAVRGALLDTALMPSKYAEDLQVTRYREGDYYELHYDFSQPNRSSVDPASYPYGDVERSATLVVYLSEGFEGGETVFPRVPTPGSEGRGLLEKVPNVDDAEWPTVGYLSEFCGHESDALKVAAGVGSAILFFDYKPDKTRDMDTVHGSCPVRKGTKIIAQQWIQINLGYASKFTLEDRLLRRFPLPPGSKDQAAQAKKLQSKPTGGKGETAAAATMKGGGSGKVDVEDRGRGGGGGEESEEALELTGGEAVATLVTNEAYALGAVVLARSIRALRAPGSGGKPPPVKLVALVTQQGQGGKPLSKKGRRWLADAGWDVRDVPLLKPTGGNAGETKERPELGVGFAKLHLWGLDEFERVLYVDADAMMLRDVAFFFHRRFWAGLFNGIHRQGHILGGFLAVRPNKATLERLMAALEEPMDFKNDEQGFLNLILKDQIEAVPQADRLPEAQHLSTAACVLRDNPNWPAQLRSAGVVDFQGVSKPWSWPEVMIDHQPCRAVKVFAMLWQAVIFSPMDADVRAVLLMFQVDRSRLTSGQGFAMPLMSAELVRIIERIGERNKEGGAARDEALRLICSAKMYEMKLPVQDFGPVLSALCQRLRQAKK